MQYSPEDVMPEDNDEPLVQQTRGCQEQIVQSEVESGTWKARRDAA